MQNEPHAHTCPPLQGKSESKYGHRALAANRFFALKEPKNGKPLIARAKPLPLPPFRPFKGRLKKTTKEPKGGHTDFKNKKKGFFKKMTDDTREFKKLTLVILYEG